MIDARTNKMKCLEISTKQNDELLLQKAAEYAQPDKKHIGRHCWT